MTKPRLQTIIFEVTQRCNHACRHCYNVWQGGPAVPGQDARCYPLGELPTPEALALLAKALDEANCRHITFTGGEPLLRPDLGQMVDLVREHGAASTVISNGRLLDEPTIVDLLERGVGLFELPLLSSRREVHDYLSGAAGAFDAVLGAMARLRHHRGHFVAVFVATRVNLPTLYDTIKLAFAFGARGLMLNRFNPGGRGRQNLAELLPGVAEMRRALEIANAAADEFHLPISCSIPIQPCLIDNEAYDRLGFGFCAAGTERAYFTLDPMGHIRPCNHTPTVLGNLRDEPLEQIVTPERLAAFCRARPAYCAGCALAASCQGGCKAAAQVCYGALEEEEPFLRQRLP